MTDAASMEGVIFNNSLFSANSAWESNKPLGVKFDSQKLFLALGSQI